MILRRPAIEDPGRMEDVLHAMDDHRSRWVLGDVEDSLHAKKIVAAHRTDHGKPARKALRRDRMVTGDAIGPDPVVVTVAVDRVMLVITVLAMVELLELLRAQPRMHVVGLAFRIVQAGAGQL